ncbi:acetyltransferase [Nocardia sp. NRRL S-836]|nr:acetyltransferase [Nocardia sp. NRRL S-836]
MLSAYDTQARPAEWANAVPGAPVHRDGPLFRVEGPAGGNVAGPPDLGVTGAELDELIARQRDFFAGRGQPVEWKTWGHDRPADLPARLEAAGFVADDRETVLIGLAGEMTGPVELDGVVLRETREEADMRRIGDCLSEVWGKDCGAIADRLVSIKDDPDVVVVVAEAEGRVVSAARLEIVPGTEFGGLWGGSTLERWRGRGIYRALVAHRARVAVQRGITYLQVDASEDSRPILERLGFVAVTTTTPYVWRP